MVPLGTDPAPARTSPEPGGALGTEVLAGQEGQEGVAVLLPAPTEPQNCQGGGAMPADPRDDEQVCNTHPRRAPAEPSAAVCHHTAGTPGGASGCLMGLGERSALEIRSEKRHFSREHGRTRRDNPTGLRHRRVTPQSHAGRAWSRQRPSPDPGDHGVGGCPGGVTAPSHCTPCPGECRPLSITGTEGVCCICKEDERKSGGTSRSPRGRSHFSSSPAEGEKV